MSSIRVKHELNKAVALAAPGRWVAMEVHKLEIAKRLEHLLDVTFCKIEVQRTDVKPTACQSSGAISCNKNPQWTGACCNAWRQIQIPEKIISHPWYQVNLKSLTLLLHEYDCVRLQYAAP
jgi:hypothetical protein